MKAYGEVNEWFQVFLTSALDGGEWSASRWAFASGGATDTRCKRGFIVLLYISLRETIYHNALIYIKRGKRDIK
jgi:hypothetical protein